MDIQLEFEEVGEEKWNVYTQLENNRVVARSHFCISLLLFPLIFMY